MPQGTVQTTTTRAHRLTTGSIPRVTGPPSCATDAPEPPAVIGRHLLCRSSHFNTPDLCATASLQATRSLALRAAGPPRALAALQPLRVAASAYRPFIPARQLPQPPPDAPVMVIDAHRSSRWFERDRRALCRLPGCPSRLRRVPGDRGRRAHAMGAQERPLHGQNPQRGERTLHADTAPL